MSDSTRSIGHIASRIVLACALITIAAAVSLFAFRTAFADEIYPGVHIGGVNVGGMSRSEATATLQAKADEITGQRAYFDGFDQHWAPTLAELGVTADIDSSIDQAMGMGRSSRQRLASAVSSLSGNHDLPLQLAIDPATLSLWSQTVNNQIKLIPHDAALTVNNGQVEINQEANGTISQPSSRAGECARQFANDAGSNRTTPDPGQAALGACGGSAIRAEHDHNGAQRSHQCHLRHQKLVHRSSRFRAVRFDQGRSTKSGADAISVTVDQDGLAS